MDTRLMFTGARKRVSEYLLGESGSVNPRSALIGGAILTTSMVGILLGAGSADAHTSCPGQQKVCHWTDWQGESHWCCDSDQTCGQGHFKCINPG